MLRRIQSRKYNIFISLEGLSKPTQNATTFVSLDTWITYVVATGEDQRV